MHQLGSPQHAFTLLIVGQSFLSEVPFFLNLVAVHRHTKGPVRLAGNEHADLPFSNDRLSMILVEDVQTSRIPGGHTSCLIMICGLSSLESDALPSSKWARVERLYPNLPRESILPISDQTVQPSPPRHMHFHSYLAFYGLSVTLDESPVKGQRGLPHNAALHVLGLRLPFTRDVTEGAKDIDGLVFVCTNLLKAKELPASYAATQRLAVLM
ncbi:hypothetical protein OPQ81_011226 [Rhizoctonia solani]|nr:hypothetical protein OPQ81_011226 [Rhizoctonia solani]